jgi:hypothetical protein
VQCEWKGKHGRMKTLEWMQMRSLLATKPFLLISFSYTYYVKKSAKSIVPQAASKMGKSTPEEAAARERALAAALDKAIQVPLQVATLANGTWPALIKMAQVCNIQTASDMQVIFVWNSLFA